jgi:hypothetical protein
MVLMRISGPTREEVTADKRNYMMKKGKICVNKPHCSDPFKEVRWAGYVACMGERKIYAGTPEAKRPFQRPRLSGRII